LLLTVLVWRRLEHRGPSERRSPRPERCAATPRALKLAASRDPRAPHRPDINSAPAATQEAVAGSSSPRSSTTSTPRRTSSRTTHYECSVSWGGGGLWPGSRSSSRSGLRVDEERFGLPAVARCAMPRCIENASARRCSTRSLIPAGAPRQPRSDRVRSTLGVPFGITSKRLYPRVEIRRPRRASPSSPTQLRKLVARDCGGASARSVPYLPPADPNYTCGESKSSSCHGSATARTLEHRQ